VLAGKQTDLVMGLDLHMEMVPTPAPVPTPFPMPFIGMIEPDPFGALLQMGMSKAMSWAFNAPPSALVLINGLPAVKTGDEAKNRKVLPHMIIPPGTAWTPLPKPLKLKVRPGPPAPPDNPAAPAGDAVMVTGSKTVYINGSNACRLGDLAMSCGEPVRLPSSTLLAIPKGPPVLIGGPPALDFQVAVKTLLLRNKWTAGALQQLISRMAPGRLRNFLHWAACQLTGHPVDVATGRLLTFPIDFELPGPIPITFQRVYASSWSERPSEIGYGWCHPFDESIQVLRGKVVYRTGDGREIEFDTFELPGRRLTEGQEIWDAATRLRLMNQGGGAWTVTAPDGITREFVTLSPMAREARLVRIRDRAGHRIELEHDEHGRLAWMTDSAGRRLRFLRDAWGRLERIALPGPTWDGWFDVVTYTYSDDGDLIAARDALGGTTTYEYVNHLIVRETDRDGVSFYFVYDGDDATASCVRTWGDGGIFDHAIVYDRANLRTLVTNSLGQTTMYQMNAANAVVAIMDPHGVWTKTEYNDVLWKTAEIDALGQATRYEYDARGNVVRTTLPNGGATSVRYNGFDLPELAVDPMGVEWTWLYDHLGRLVVRRSSAGDALKLHYEGALPRIVEMDGDPFELRHDEHGNLTHIRRPDGVTIVRKFDRLGRLSGFRDPAGNLTLIETDLLGRVTRVQDPEGTIRSASYSPEGDVREVYNGYTYVRYTYEGFHWLASQTVGGDTIRWRRDTEGRLVAVTNEVGETYTFVRDARGDVQAEIGFDKRTHTFERDVARRVTAVIKPSKKQQKLAYDALGNITEIAYEDGTKESFTYSPVGQLLSATNEHGTAWFQRDARGRLLAEGIGSDWVASAYDWKHRRVGLRTSRGHEQTIERDVLGNVAAVNVPTAGWRAAFQRDVFGQERARALPGAVHALWERDALGRPIARHVGHGGQWTRRTTYEWHGLERIRGIDDSLYGLTRYVHDERSRLVGAERPMEGQYVHRRLDPAGNLFKTADGRDRRYGRGGVLLEAEGTRYGYDWDGNVVVKELPSGEKWEYAWNAAGRLAEVKRPDGVRVAFKYDALARRMEKAVYAKEAEEPEKTVRWLWDGNVPVHEVEGDTNVTTWLFEPETFAPLGKLEGGRGFGVVTDHLGTPTQMFDEVGRLAWQMQLDVYGVAREDVAETRCPWRWPGQYEDEEVGLYYNRFRYFDPSRGGYVSQDPIRLLGGSEVYAYPADPLVTYDFFGLAVIVIGEIQQRVAAFAHKIGAREIRPDWPKHLVFNPYVADKHEAMSVEFNRRWINEQMDAGHTIIDIGRAPKNLASGKPMSPFYAAELEEIAKRGYTERVRSYPKDEGRQGQHEHACKGR
jgi:RHS repeat-associated protein